VFLRGHPERIRAVAFAPDGRISSVGDDGSLRTWDCTICVRRAALVRLAKLRLASLRQSLTPVERQRYLGVR
jgi:WD40 repeat protein